MNGKGQPPPRAASPVSRQAADDNPRLFSCRTAEYQNLSRSFFQSRPTRPASFFRTRGAPSDLAEQRLYRDAAIHRPCIAVARVKGRVRQRRPVQVFHPVSPLSAQSRKADGSRKPWSRHRQDLRCQNRACLSRRESHSFPGHLVHIHITGWAAVLPHFVKPGRNPRSGRAVPASLSRPDDAAANSRIFAKLVKSTHESLPNGNSPGDFSRARAIASGVRYL